MSTTLSDRTGIRDEAGWTRLFELYALAIRAFAEERESEGESEDVVQEIFMRLVEVLREGRVKVGGDAGVRCDASAGRELL